MEESFYVTGMMSGTSLDGMDLILSRFFKISQNWQYEFIKAETVPYSQDWKNRLTNAPNLDTQSFLNFHNEYGEFIGRHVAAFVASAGHRVDLVASHGHTVFHQPSGKFTFQLGSGASIAATCMITTVSDFRTMDVALGGQGAPLVPAGDDLLYAEYEFCLNLGGFANISNRFNGIRVACDLCPVNIVANELSGRYGAEFDKDGLTGRSGQVSDELVSALNNLDYYSKSGPRSLGREWVESTFMPLIESSQLPVKDLLRSVYEHIAVQISNYINAYGKGKVLVTGGGAFNIFLMEILRQKSGLQLIVPDERTVKFKEALIFAFLGLLRSLNEVNCYASVTGAKRDSSTGVIHRI